MKDNPNETKKVELPSINSTNHYGPLTGEELFAEACRQGVLDGSMKPAYETLEQGVLYTFEEGMKSMSQWVSVVESQYKGNDVYAVVEMTSAPFVPRKLAHEIVTGTLDDAIKSAQAMEDFNYARDDGGERRVRRIE